MHAEQQRSAYITSVNVECLNSKFGQIKLAMQSCSDRLNNLVHSQSTAIEDGATPRLYQLWLL